MKRRQKLLTALGLLLLAAVCLLHPAVRWRLIGWARSEAFYDGRPTSYWRQEIDSSYAEIDLADGRPSMSIWFRTPSQLDEWLATWRGSGSAGWAEPAWQNDPAALSVLVALLADESVQVRRFAAHALRLLGTQAKPASPAILQATQDDDATVRRDAQAAWERITPPSP